MMRKFLDSAKPGPAGKKVPLTNASKAGAERSPDADDLPPRQPGALKGKIWIADNFDEFDEELEEMFYGGPISPER